MADTGCTGIYKSGIPENAGGSGRQPGGIFRNGLQGRREKENGILADAQEQQRPIKRQKTFVSGWSGETLAYPEQPGLERYREDTGKPSFPEFGNNGTKVSNADGTGLQTPGAEQQTTGPGGCGEIPDAGNIWSVEWQRKLRSDKQVIRTGKNNGGRTEIDAIREWWEVEPPVCCLVDGLPPGMDGYEGRICNNAYRRAPQLKGLGNAIVPHIAMLIWLMIKELL
jgi:hypothetical protein